jgi:hypothetical protein
VMYFIFNTCHVNCTGYGNNEMYTK